MRMVHLYAGKKTQKCINKYFKKKEVMKLDGETKEDNRKGSETRNGRKWEMEKHYILACKCPYANQFHMQCK